MNSHPIWGALVRMADRRLVIHKIPPPIHEASWVSLETHSPGRHSPNAPGQRAAAQGHSQGKESQELGPCLCRITSHGVNGQHLN